MFLDGFSLFSSVLAGFLVFLGTFFTVSKRLSRAFGVLDGY